MPFNINTFRSTIDHQGTLNPNKFSVNVVPPPMFSGTSLVSTMNDNSASFSNLAQLLTFRVEDVLAPSVGLAMTEVSRYGVSPNVRVPFNAAFNPLTITFISDGYGQLWNFWYQWLKNVFGFSGTNNGQNGTINQAASYFLGYKADYTTTVTVFIYDQAGNIRQTIIYNEAFPFAINDTKLNWGENNQLLKITVDMAFKDFIINGSDNTGTTLSANFNPSEF